MHLTQGVTSTRPASDVRVPEPVKNPYNVGEIVNAHIFGEKRREVVAAPKIEKPKKVEKTRLRLKLLGLVSSSKDGMARALITAENGRLQSYGVGEQIENTDSSVHSIEEMRVLLDRDGRLESLEMTRPALQKKKQDNQTSAARTARNEPVQQPQLGNNGGGFVEQGQDPADPNFNQNRVDRLPVPEDVLPDNNPELLGQDPYDPENPELLGQDPYDPDQLEQDILDDSGSETYSDLSESNESGNQQNRRSVAPKFPF